MRKKIYITTLLLTATTAFSQVIVGSSINPSPNSMFSIVNKEDNPAGSKGMMIPTVNSETELPYITHPTPTILKMIPACRE